jgi:hypothetical protein
MFWDIYHKLSESLFLINSGHNILGTTEIKTRLKRVCKVVIDLGAVWAEIAVIKDV